MMKRFLSQIKEKIVGPDYEELNKKEEDVGYVEIASGDDDGKSKIVVRPFVLEDFEDVKLVLDSLREGHTIALVNIKPLKEKDLVELKRAINKLKKTTEAVEGDIAGFGDDWIAITPSFGKIHRTSNTSKPAATKPVHSDVFEADTSMIY